MTFNDLCNLYGIDNIFKDISIPRGLNKEILINTILDKCALATPVFPEFDILYAKVLNFFLKNYDIFDKLYLAFNANYNPIENYDRKEERTNKFVSKRNDENMNISKVSPYDSNAYENDTQSTLNADSNINDETTEVIKTHGNIGVTTSQQMLESELLLRPKLNIYEVIANNFYREFCLFIF